MQMFLAALILLGIGIIGMCFNIIFRKNGQFPQTEVSSNENMRKLGIRCIKEQENELRNRGRDNISCSGNITDSCTSCGFYTYEQHN